MGDAQEWVDALQKVMNRHVNGGVIYPQLVPYFKKLMIVEIDLENDQWMRLARTLARYKKLKLIRCLISNEMRKKYIYQPLVQGIIRNFEKNMIGAVISN